MHTSFHFKKFNSGGVWLLRIIFETTLYFHYFLIILSLGKVFLLYQQTRIHLTKGWSSAKSNAIDSGEEMENVKSLKNTDNDRVNFAKPI